MKNEDRISKVIALFDKDDVQYIKATAFLKHIDAATQENSQHMKKFGGKNDKCRK